MKEKMYNGEKAGLRTALVVALVIGMVFSFVALPHPGIEKTDDGRSWRFVIKTNIVSAAEASPAAGASAVLEVFYINHSATNAYANRNSSALLEGWCNANLAAGGGNAWVSSDLSSYDLQLKHSVLFDIAVKVRVNKSHVWDGSMFHAEWARMNITSNDMSLSDAAMQQSILENDSSDDFIWLMFYYDFGDAGYDLSRNENISKIECRLDAYY